MEAVTNGLLNRRAFILLLGGAVGWTLFGDRATGTSLVKRRVHTVPWESVLRAGLPLDDGLAHQLGASYAAMSNDGATMSDVVLQLRPCPGVTWTAGGPRSWRSRNEVVKRVHHLLTDEYAKGDTILNDGWILSRTEAALCAAAWLSDQGQSE